MMKINFDKDGDKLNVNLDGRLDALTAPELESFLNANTDGINELMLNCEKLSYVSSAGLRVLLAAHKKAKPSMKLTNVCELVAEVFDITGFSDILVVVK